jgi:hypothetical protein
MRIWRVMVFKEAFDGVSLVIWHMVDITESSARWESTAVWMASWVYDSALGFKNRVARVHFRGSYVSDIRTTGSSQWVIGLRWLGTHLLGHAGEKIVALGPRQPLSLSSPLGPETPSSPEA